MLNGKLVLHDVDAEKLARKALNDALRSRHIYLYPGRYEDALSELVTAAWELSERFQPGRGHSFSTGCYRLLRLRFTDWIRRTEGRTTWTFSSHTYERQIPVVLSLDAVPSGRGLVEAVAGGSVDSSPYSGADLKGALLSRGGRRPGYLETPGGSSP